MRQPSFVKHIRDIIILPFTVTVIIPYFIYNKNQAAIPDGSSIKFFGILFFLSGIFLFLYTVYLFRTFGKGTLAPWVPTQKLIILGPYRYCRNPMISAVLFILTGETLFLHSTNILIWAGIFFITNTLYFILKEEPDLYKRFGDEYSIYKKNVPRWIPRLSPYSENK